MNKQNWLKSVKPLSLFLHDTSKLNLQLSRLESDTASDPKAVVGGANSKVLCKLRSSGPANC